MDPEVLAVLDAAEHMFRVRAEAWEAANRLAAELDG